MFILHNNENFGLTTGQASACTRSGNPMNGSPDGVLMNPINCCDFVLGLEPTFVARSFSADVNHMTDMFRAGLNHNGFAFVEVLQTCPTYNRATPQEWYMDRVQYLEKSEKTIEGARKKAKDMEDKINLGIFYQEKDSVNFLERLAGRNGIKTNPIDEVKRHDIKRFLGQFE